MKRKRRALGGSGAPVVSVVSAVVVGSAVVPVLVPGSLVVVVAVVVGVGSPVLVLEVTTGVPVLVSASAISGPPQAVRVAARARARRCIHCLYQSSKGASDHRTVFQVV